MTDVYNNFYKIVKENSDLAYRDYLEAKEKISNSSAYYRGKPVGFLYHALFNSQDDIINFREISEILTGILKKVVNEFLVNPGFRKKFRFSELMEELILINPGYKNFSPIGRFDLFYNFDDEYKFCELNTDGSSSMNEVRVIQDVIREIEPMKRLSKKYQFVGFELFYSWIDAIIDNYKEFNSGIDDKPNVAIIDFEGEGILYEFKEFQKRFIEKGYNTIICDPRELRYRNGKLHYKDMVIKLIYRRATTSRIYEEADSIKDLLEAYKDKAICMVGGLRSQIIHNKILFAILHDYSHLDFLSQDEIGFIKKHIPETHILEKNNSLLLDNVLNNKDNLILKPFDSFASRGVYPGRDYNMAEWEKLLAEIGEEDYLIQEFVDIPEMDMGIPTDKTIQFEKFRFLTGMFLYNQEFKGLYTRVGRKNIIAPIQESFTVPNFIISNKI